MTTTHRLRASTFALCLLTLTVPMPGCSGQSDDEPGADSDAAATRDSAVIDASAVDAAFGPDARAAADAHPSDSAISSADAAGTATGESCASPIPLAIGTATYAFSATTLDHLSASLLRDAGCIPSAVLSGPDIVFSYAATGSGMLDVTVQAMSDFKGGQFRVAAVMTDDPCAEPILDQTGTCASNYSATPSVAVGVPVTAGTTYYLIVAKTDSSPNTFRDSEVTIAVTAP